MPPVPWGFLPAFFPMLNAPSCPLGQQRLQGSCTQCKSRWCYRLPQGERLLLLERFFCKKITRLLPSSLPQAHPEPSPGSRAPRLASWEQRVPSRGPGSACSWYGDNRGIRPRQGCPPPERLPAAPRRWVHAASSAGLRQPLPTDHRGGSRVPAWAPGGLSAGQLEIHQLPRLKAALQLLGVANPVCVTAGRALPFAIPVLFLGF